MAVAGLLWPIPLTAGLGEERLMVACGVATVAALQARCIRSHVQLLQLAMLLPLGALLTELLLLLHNQIGVSTWGQPPSSNWELASEALLTTVILMLATLLIPALEFPFGLLSRMRLIELMNQERPLLRLLSSEAPETFEHTLMICGLAEEGARAIWC